jgi:hypothetical protein
MASEINESPMRAHCQVDRHSQEINNQEINNQEINNQEINYFPVKLQISIGDAACQHRNED